MESCRRLQVMVEYNPELKKINPFSPQKFPDNVVSPIVSVPVPQEGAVGPQAQAPAGASAACPAAPAASLGSYRIIDSISFPSSEKSRSEEHRSQLIIGQNKNLINDFKEYLANTAKCRFTNHGVSWDCYEGPHAVSKNIGYIHRWTPVYRKSVIAKMYLLEKWHNLHSDLPVTMGTFTTYQDGIYSQKLVCRKTSIEEAFVCLKKSWKKLSMWLRLYAPDLEFVYFFEPHKSGYPHFHVIFFGDLSPEIQDKIKHLWADKYKAGSLEHGANFRPVNNLKSVRNYIIKYVAKILHHSNVNEWSPGELLFNATMWKNKYRLWGASRPLSQAMKRPVVHVDADAEGLDTDVILSHGYAWTHTTMTDPNGDIHLLKTSKIYDSTKIDNQILQMDS